MITDQSLLEAALVGYERQREEIEAKIAEIREHLGSSPAAESVPGSDGKRTMSAAARRRIAAAQKKRWAEYKKSHGTTAKESKPKKRTLSPEAKKHIAEATRKRWIAYRAAKAASQKASAKSKRAAKKVSQATSESAAS